MQAHRPGVLDRDVAEPADAGDRHNSPGLASVSFRPFQVVTPAHRIGAIAANSTVFGNRAANGAEAIRYSANQPFTP